MPLISLIAATSATMLALLVPLEPDVPLVRIVPAARNPNPVPLGNPGSWVNASDYPRDALTRKIEGTTGFRVFVDRNGDVKDCTIIQSSGNADLDAATCIKVFIRAKFIPAKDENGAAVAGIWSSRVRWEIPKGTADNTIVVEAGRSTIPRQIPLSPGFSEFKYTVKADGSIVDCTAVTEGSFRREANSTFDFCQNIAKVKFYPSADENGKLLERRVIMKSEVKVEPVK